MLGPIPIRSAVRLGCTDIVVMLTRSRKFRRRPRKFVYDVLSLTYFRDWPKESRDSLFWKFSQVNEIYDFLWSIEGDNGKYRVMIIAPNDDGLAGILWKRKRDIELNLRLGCEDATQVLKFSGA